MVSCMERQAVLAMAGLFWSSQAFRAVGRDKAWVEETKRYFRKTAAPVVPVLEALPPPPPGTYELVVQVMTPDQGLVVGSSLMLEVISSTIQDAAVAAGTLAPFVLEHEGPRQPAVHD